MRCFPTQLPVGLFLLDYHGIANLPTILQLDGYFKIAELGDAIHFTFLQEFGWAAMLGNNFFLFQLWVQKCCKISLYSSVFLGGFPHL